MDLRKYKSLFQYLSQPGAQPIQIHGKRYLASPFPTSFEIKVGGFVVFCTPSALASSIACEIGVVIKKETSYTEWPTFDINLVPPKEGGIVFEICKVELQSITHVLRLSPK